MQRPNKRAYSSHFTVFSCGLINGDLPTTFMCSSPVLEELCNHVFASVAVKCPWRILVMMRRNAASQQIGPCEMWLSFLCVVCTYWYPNHHDDVIKWKHFPRYWPFVRGIHRSRWIPRTKASDAKLRLNQQLNNHWRRRWFETPSHSLWRHCSVSIKLPVCDCHIHRCW